MHVCLSLRLPCLSSSANVTMILHYSASAMHVAQPTISNRPAPEGADQAQVGPHRAPVERSSKCGSSRLARSFKALLARIRHSRIPTLSASSALSLALPEYSSPPPICRLRFIRLHCRPLHGCRIASHDRPVIGSHPFISSAVRCHPLRTYMPSVACALPSSPCLVVMVTATLLTAVEWASTSDLLKSVPDTSCICLQPRSSRSSPRFAFGKISFLDSRGIDTPGFPAANLSRPTAASPSLPLLRPYAPAPPMPSPKDPRAAMIAMSAPRPSLLAVTPPLSLLRRLRRIVRHLARLPLPVQEGLRHPPSRSPSMFPAPHHVLPNRFPCRISSRGSLCAAPHASGSSVTLLAHFSVASLFLLRAFPSTWLLPSSPMPSTANHVPPIS